MEPEKRPFYTNAVVWFIVIIIAIIVISAVYTLNK